MNETETYKKFKNKQKDNFPEYYIIHHSGGTDANPSADTSTHTARDMEIWHTSMGWEGLGYQYVIHKNGDIWLGRPEHYHGAHTVGYNSKSIGICLAGNFDVTLPTKEQTKSLALLLKDLQTRYNLKHENIVPHRLFAKKSCYGNKLPDTWASDLLDKSSEEMVSIPKNLIKEFLKYV